MSNFETSNDTPSTADSVVEPMVDVSALPVFILPDCVKTVLSSGAEKFISHEDFLQLLSKVIDRGGDALAEPLNLPSNVFGVAKDAVNLTLSCYYKSQVSKVMYYDKVMDMVLPNIIITHKLQKSAANWDVVSSHYFCTDLPVNRLVKPIVTSISHADRIYLFPMSNTYDSGNMCYGNNSMPRRFSNGNLRGLDWYYQYLFESPFNDDLGIKAIGQSSRVSEWYSTLEKCATKGEPFPYSRLSGYVPQ